jgi:hypothetical protein
MRKLLVANRSEIATRVFRAAAELSWDRRGLHLRRPLLPASIQGGRIVPDRPDAGWRAGQGLSQHRQHHRRRQGARRRCDPSRATDSLRKRGFAKACQDAGITFVGPTPKLLETFGDKTAAKRIATKAGVPTVPGTEHGWATSAK